MDSGSDALDPEDAALLQRLKEEGIRERFYGPRPVESVDQALEGKARSRAESKAKAARAQRHKELNQLVRDERKKRRRQDEKEHPMQAAVADASLAAETNSATPATDEPACRQPSPPPPSSPCPARPAPPSQPTPLPSLSGSLCFRLRSARQPLPGTRRLSSGCRGSSTAASTNMTCTPRLAKSCAAWSLQPCCALPSQARGSSRSRNAPTGAPARPPRAWSVCPS